MNCSASLEAECLDVRSAVATLRKKPSEKRLLILYVESSHELDELSRLSACLPGWPLLALVGGDHPHSGSSGGIIGVMRAGAAQIVYVPIQPVDFKAALDRLAVQFVFTAQDTKVIAVAGSTGGSGCTTIAINLAYEIACRHGLRCVLAELSLRMGAVAAHLNIEPTHTIIDLLKDARRVDTVLAQKVLHQVAENLHVLAGPHQFVTPSNVSIEDLTHIVDTVKQMTEVVVLDLPCTYDDIYFETLASAGVAILVGEQTLPSIRALRMVRDQVGRNGRTEHVVINRFDPKNAGFSVDRLLAPLGVDSVVTVVRDDAGMGAALRAGCALRKLISASPGIDGHHDSFRLASGHPGAGQARGAVSPPQPRHHKHLRETSCPTASSSSSMSKMKCRSVSWSRTISLSSRICDLTFCTPVRKRPPSRLLTPGASTS